MKKTFMAGITTVLAGLVLASSAGAQIFAYDVPFNAPTKATGSYHVIFTITGATTMNVSVQGKYDGNFTNIGPLPANPQKHTADSMTFTFFNGANQVNVTGGTGAVTAGTDNGDGAISPHHTSVAGAWTFSGGFGTYKMDAASSNNAINAFGYNIYTGTISFAHPVNSVDMSIVNNSQQWFMSGAVLNTVPEASSLALFLPGLLPLGLVLRKRRQSRK